MNETAIKQLGLTDPIGRSIKSGGKRGEIIGVVKDFHFESLQTSIAPLILSNNPKEFSMVSIKSNSNLVSSIASVSDIIKTYAPTTYKDFFLMDEQVNLLYLSEQQLIKIANIFSFISIFLACFGLLAIAAYTAEQRTKEIGIRKAVGASTFSIVVLLSKNFTKLILISFLFGFPISWFATNKWLANYPYRINIGPDMYLLISLAVVLIAWLTISYESIKAATTYPVKTLRSSD